MIDGAAKARRSGISAGIAARRSGSPIEQWPELIHPFASAIDTELPAPPASVHLLLRDKAGWVVPQVGPDDECYEGYPALSIEDWHKRRNLWIE